MQQSSDCLFCLGSHISCDPYPLFVMDNKKKNVTAPAATDQGNGPIKVFKVDDVSASVFSRIHSVNGEDVTFYSVSFSRSYRESSGVRKYVKTFNIEDLLKVVTVAQECDEFVHKLQHPEIA
jgi:hypothetical protein